MFSGSPGFYSFWMNTKKTIKIISSLSLIARKATRVSFGAVGKGRYMEDFKKDEDEDILLRAGNIHVKSRSLEACLTNKNIVLIDRESGSFRRIPLYALAAIESGENAIRDPFILFSVRTQSGTRQVRLTFARTGGGSRSRERDGWLQSVRKSHALRSVQNPPRETGTTRGNPPGARPGNQLGTYCTHCGLRVSDAASFCERCGTRIIRDEFPTEPAPSPSALAMVTNIWEEIPVIVTRTPEASSTARRPDTREHGSPKRKHLKNRRKFFLVAAGIIIVFFLVLVFVVLPNTGILPDFIPLLSNSSAGNATTNTAANLTMTVPP